MRAAFLIIALGAALSACASAPGPAADKAEASIAAETGRIEQAFDLVESNYYQKIPRSTLNEACLDALGAPRPTSADPASIRAAIASALRRQIAKQPSQEPQSASEPCLRKALGTLNRHSAYIDAAELRALTGAGSFGSVGLELGASQDGARLVDVLEGTPAEHAGLRKGEILTRIDDRDLAGLELEKIVNLLRGAPRSVVNLALRDSQTRETRTVAVRRGLVVVKTVRIRPIPPDLVYVRITQLGAPTAKLLSDGLASAMAPGAAPPKGIILDLRSSSGGLLYTSIAIAAAFLPKDALVADMKGSSERNNQRFVASAVSYGRRGWVDPLASLPAWAPTVPMMVLVGKTTASGAESVAAALQDHGRATLIGARTFGKGTVESLYPLRMGGGGAIKFTTANLYRPNGNEIESIGVTPDVTVSSALDATDRSKPDPEPDLDPVLAEAIRLLRRR